MRDTSRDWVDRLDFEVVHEDDDFRVTWNRAESDGLTLSFTGVGGNIGQIPQEEFLSIASDEGRRSVLFIIDKKRFWFHSDEKNARGFAAVEKFARRSGANDVVTIGNSMGGFGALIASRYLNVARTLAFCPQFAVDPSVMPEETRWRQFVDAIPFFDVRSVGDADLAGVQTDVFFGAARDADHVARFRELDTIRVHVVEGAGHNIAGHLKERGVLRDLCLGLLYGDLSEPADFLRARGLLVL